MDGGRCIFGFNLALPNVEKRWQLRFSSYDEAQDERNLQQRTVRTIAPPNDPGAAMVFFKKLGSIRTSFQPRLQLQSPLQVAYVLRFERPIEGKTYRILPKLELYADSAKGTGEFTGLRLTAKPHEKSKWEFELENDEEYRQNANDFVVTNGFIVDYALADRKSLAASLVAGSENHNYHLNSIRAAISYGEDIYRQLLKYSVSPYISFDKSYAFHGHPGLSCTLAVIF